MANGAASSGNLTETGSAKIGAVHSYHRRALRAAISLKRTYSKCVFKCERHPFGKLLGTSEHISQASKMLGRTAANISLQKSRSRDQERDAIVAYQFADYSCVQGIGVENDTVAIHGRQPQRHGKPKRMEEGQNTENLVVAAEHEDLQDLVDVAGNVVMREHYTLGIPCRPTGKDHSGQIVEPPATCAKSLLQKPIGE